MSTLHSFDIVVSSHCDIALVISEYHLNSPLTRENDHERPTSGQSYKSHKNC